MPQVLNLDRYRLTQILLNLVGNAVKFTDRGRVDIDIEWIKEKEAVEEECFKPRPFNDEDDDEGVFEKDRSFAKLNDTLFVLNFRNTKILRDQIKLNTNERKGILKIVVSDTGVGIAKDSLDKLFQKFSQVTEDPSRRKLGTGLGLFITRELCSKMRGEIKVFSKPDKGSVFTICLPIDAVLHEPTQLLDMNVIKNMIRRERPVAMVVDDQKFNLNILKTFLSKIGADVTDTAENGLDALNKFKTNVANNKLINLITMDLDMPVMDGKTSAQKIREYERENNLCPCIMLIVSGNCGECEIKECMNKDGRIRADAFLKKPVSIDELARTIASFLVRPSLVRKPIRRNFML